MDRNLLLATALSMLVFTLYVAQQAQREPVTPIEAPSGDSVEGGSRSEEAADSGTRPSPTLDAGTGSEPAEGRSDSASPSSPGQDLDVRQPAFVVEPGETETAEATYVFDSDLVRAELSSRGAALRSWQLKRFQAEVGNGDDLIDLVRGTESLPDTLRTPLLELARGDLGEANYRIESRNDTSVTFVLRRADVIVRKAYTFDPGSYTFELVLEVENLSDDVLSPRFDVVWTAAVVEDEQDFLEEALVVRSQDEVVRDTVASFGSPGFFGDLFGGSSSDGGPVEFTSPIDWAGVDLKYFVSALLPDSDLEARVVFNPVRIGKVATASVGYRALELSRGESKEVAYRGYMGPKETTRLVSVDPTLEESINLGWSWIAPLTSFFRWLLPAVYAFTGNYGLAIIIITIGVRILTAPIMAKQMKSMERMRELQPRMKEIQEQFKDDRQKQSEATMAMYKETGVNPLGGCFPMVLQFPVFIGLFYALQSSIELRHAPFMLWINDLSSPENLIEIPGLGLPLRLLPIAMGASMVIQQKMTPQTSMDPAQAKMMMTVMPIMMTVLFYQFPSGLVLYWMVSNVLGILHQLWVRRGMTAEA